MLTRRKFCQSIGAGAVALMLPTTDRASLTWLRAQLAALESRGWSVRFCELRGPMFGAHVWVGDRIYSVTVAPDYLKCLGSRDGEKVYEMRGERTAETWRHIVADMEAAV